MLAQTRREPARAHGSLVVQRSGRDSNPRDELTPPTRFPVVLLQPLGHHSRGLPVSHGGRPGMPGQRFSRCERLLGRRGHLRRPGQGRSFPLAPSASRSRLKLRRGTEAFRGNGTQAEWTKRQAFGHFVFHALASRPHAGSSARSAVSAISRCERFSASRGTCGGGSVVVHSLSHRTLSRTQTKPRRGVGSPLG